MLKTLTPSRRADILHTAMIIPLAVLGVTLGYRSAEGCALLMASVLAFGLWRWHTRADLWLVASGVVIGPTLEHFATQSGLWAYPHTTFSTLPLWVFALWPAYPLCLVRLTHALLPPGERQSRPVRDLTAGLLIIGLEVPVLCLWGRDAPGLTAGVTALMLGVAMAVLRSPQVYLMLFISGVVGPVCESLPVAAGAWGYPAPVLLGLPAYLPTGYALFGLGLVMVAQGLHGISLPVAEPRGAAVPRGA